MIMAAIDVYCVPYFGPRTVTMWYRKLIRRRTMAIVKMMLSANDRLRYGSVKLMPFVTYGFVVETWIRNKIPMAAFIR